MTRFPIQGRSVFVTPGIVISLAAFALAAPPRTHGGCSGVVTSRADWVQVPSFLLETTREPLGASFRPNQSAAVFRSVFQPSSSTPRDPRGCWGAKCARDQAGSIPPSRPANPRADTGALCAATRQPALTSPSRLIHEASNLRPIDFTVTLFRPPPRSFQV
jgi:hypothetical protein